MSVLIINNMFGMLLLALYFCSVNSELQEYCSAPLNKSDCGLAPTPVFSYYKPGSICKIAMWKGCPTKNLFNSEHNCSSHCIGNVAVTDEEDRCDVPLNTNACTQQTTEVFTFSKEKQTCVEALWHGCPSLNMFNDKLSCVETCHNHDTKLEWIDKLRSLDINLIKGMYNVLDEIIKTNELTDEENVNKEKDTTNALFKSHQETTAKTTVESGSAKNITENVTKGG